VISVRVVEVIPGKSTIGLEIPNAVRHTVYLSEVLQSEVYDRSSSPLTIALGKSIGGSPRIADITRMPHVLVAGTTGSGKSVALNAMILSLLYKATPEQVRLVMVDPKMLELSPVVTDMKEAANALRWCVAEMERRYRLMASFGVRNLAGFNKKIKEAADKGQPLTDPLWKPALPDVEEEAPELELLPYIVVVIDEFADLMMIVGKKIEELIARLAQKARAAGVHLVLATQRPSVDVITGLGIFPRGLTHHSGSNGRRATVGTWRHALPATGVRFAGKNSRRFCRRQGSTRRHQVFETVWGTELR